MAHCSDTGKGDKLMNSTVAAATKPSNTNNKIKHSTGENVGTFVIYLVVALFALICVLPFGIFTPYYGVGIRCMA